MGEVHTHTRGPWRVYEHDPLVIVNAEGSSLGEMSAGDPFISYEQMQANARVAAEAAEMLGLLEQLVGITPHRTLDRSAPLFKRMEAAIAKALGKVSPFAPGNRAKYASGFARMECPEAIRLSAVAAAFGEGGL